MLNVSNLISQCGAAFEAFRLRKEFVDRDQADGRVDVFFDHRRSRSTVAMVRDDNLFTFEVRRTMAVALEARLAAGHAERRRALAEFLEQWRQL